MPVIVIFSSREEPQISMAFHNINIEGNLRILSLDTDYRADGDFRLFLDDFFTKIKETHHSETQSTLTGLHHRFLKILSKYHPISSSTYPYLPYLYLPRTFIPSGSSNMPVKLAQKGNLHLLHLWIPSAGTYAQESMTCLGIRKF